MFKTSEECRLELVAHTVEAYQDGYGIAWTEANFLPVSAARASFARESKTGEDEKADLKLMKYLADHEHLTPFEYNHATFLVECPLFIRSQIMRHRTFAFNEISRRYTSEDIGFWIPDEFRIQSKSNKQASTDAIFDGYLYTEERDGFDQGAHEVWEGAHTWPVYLYGRMLKEGICREQARAVLPQSLLTRFYMGGSLRNWVHFLRLRLDPHAQKEVQVVARRIESQLRALWPEPMNALMPEEPTQC